MQYAGLGLYVIIEALIFMPILLIAVYYVAFFVQRHEAFTLLQIVTLLCAAMLLLSVRHDAAPSALLVVASVVVAAIVFVVMDRDSHSVSDTLNRIVPTYALLTAVLFKTASGTQSQLGQR